MGHAASGHDGMVGRPATEEGRVLTRARVPLKRLEFLCLFFFFFSKLEAA